MQFNLEQSISIALGVFSVVAMLVLSRRLYAPGSGAGGVSLLEFIYYITALAGLLIGWYFNFQFMETGGTWVTWIEDIFVNPASASAGQDLFLANLIILPLWTIFDGRRSKLPAYWLYFPMSIVTSFAFAAALFLAVRERQLRVNAKT